MSRAFTKEDSGEPTPRRRYNLPDRSDPEYDAVAASVLLEAARAGETASAEEATGYYWGEQRLHPHVRAILARARKAHDDRMEQLAERFLR